MTGTQAATSDFANKQMEDSTEGVSDFVQGQARVLPNMKPDHGINRSSWKHLVGVYKAHERHFVVD